jgi:DNA-binding response OmpR family regulator
MKILLIEDEKELALGIENYLKGNDYVCEWAENIKTALEKNFQSPL